MKTDNKKFRVEIYFILYLAALILLLPEKDNNDDNTTVTGTYFEIKPEKNVLNLKLIKERKRNRIRNFDSTNRIYFTGDFKNVDFSYEIKDVNREESILIEDYNNSKGQFEFNPNFNENYIDFKWSPDLNRNYNTTYIVKIIANVENEEENLTKSTQFSLNTFFLNKIPEFSDNFETDEADLQSDTSSNNNTILLNLGDFDYILNNSSISTYANHEWSNEIRLFGIEEVDEISKPIVNISRDSNSFGGNVNVEDITDNKIILSGATPAAGQMEVNVVVKRIVDNTKLEIAFTVNSVKRLTPDYTEIMYPNIEYQITPNFDVNIEGEIITIISVDGNPVKTHRFNTQFSFKPSKSMIGKNVSLIRKMEGKKLDEYNIQIRNFPEPEVYNYYVKEGRLFIKTRSFQKSDKNPVIKVQNDANIEFNELIGLTSEDNNYILQTFRSTILPNSLKSINLTVIDKKGNDSEIIEINLK